MAHPHHLDNFLGSLLRILLLYQLRKGAFEAWEAHQTFQFGGTSVGYDSTFGDDDNAVAELLYSFQYM
jgi:hypothetical protein